MMKKITLFMCFLITSMGFSQELLTNGDFELGDDGSWIGNAKDIRTEGGNSFNFANVETLPANVYDVNLSNVVEIIENETYTLTFDASSDGPRTLVAGIGLNEGSFAAQTSTVNLTTETQTFTLVLTATGFGSANSRVLFDMGGDTGVVVIDNVSLMVTVGSCDDGMMNGDEEGVDCGGSCANACPGPDGPAPLPDSPDGETYSIYNDSNSYTTVFPFSYSFGEVAGEPDLDDSDAVNKALQFNFSVAGYGAGEGGPDDISAYDFVSFDYWATAGTPGFRVVLISNDGAVAEYNYEIGDDEPIVTEAWTKVSIPMTFFTDQGFSETAFFQWKFDPFMQDVDQGGIVYMDNFLLTQTNLLSVNSFDASAYSVFPNPTSGNWTIKTNSIQIKSVKVYDILGKQVNSFDPMSNEVKIDGSTLSKGLYLARIESENGNRTIKLVKE